MQSLFADLRFACRSLQKDRGFTTAALLTLGVGIALFLTATTVTRAYLLRDLPYPAAERLYWVRYGGPASPAPRGMDRLDWASLSDVIEYPIAWDLDAFYVLGSGTTETLEGAWATRGFIEGLGVRPVLGRGLSEEAFRAGGPNEVLISHELWQERFGGTPAALGKTFAAYVSDRPQETEHFRVVGVLPASFWHLNRHTEVLAPLRVPTFPYMARLRPGVDPERVRQRVTALVAGGASEVPKGWSAALEGVHDAYPGTEPVSIVSETLARRLWPEGPAVGRLVTLPEPDSTEPAPRHRVVGVAADVRQGPLDEELADAYLPMLQEPGRFAFALLRSSAPPSDALQTLRTTVRDADAEIALDRATSMTALMDRMLAGSRLLAGLLAGFAAAAAGLAPVGIYGTVAYAVRQREREIAVRVAVGAEPGRIVGLFVRQGAAIVGAGLLLGIPGALVVGRLIESQLFGVTPRDPAALALASIAFGIAALVATWWPARQAAVTDPSIALRVE